MKLVFALVATVFAVSVFAQAPAKKEEPKKEAAKAEAKAPAKADAKPAAPAKNDEAKK